MLDKYPDLETAYEERLDDKQDSVLQVRWGRKYVRTEVNEAQEVTKEEKNEQPG